MGKLLHSAVSFHTFGRVIVSEKTNAQRPKQAKVSPFSNNSHNCLSHPISQQPNLPPLDPAQLGPKMEGSSGRTRVPLSEVVSDCVQRWFEDTVKEAKAGDPVMQLLVGQMYNSGYGAPKDTDKGRGWIIKASKSRSSALNSGNKQPGFNASDSDSEDLDDAKS